MTPRHLYLHVPFCVRRCSYCDFAVTVSSDAPVMAWIDTVALELERLAEQQGWAPGGTLDTVYCGGGTPSLLGADAMARLRDRLAPTVTWDDGAEWTCEANPESFTIDVARGWRAAGVNRISLGAQTFHEPALRWMGRLHGVDGPAAALAHARTAGIDNVSIDLIFGLPDRLGRDWSADLERTASLQPQHVSLYGLTAEAATPLGKWVASGREQLADEARYAREYREAIDRLGAHGFSPYEVSNFARPGRESRHNQAYWDGRAYLGLGSGAHSYQRPRRWWNARDWADYRSRIEAGGLAIEGEETLTPAQEQLESLWLGLRQASGVPADRLTNAQRELAGQWAKRGWAEPLDTRLRLTTEGWLLLDRLAVELDGAGTMAGLA